MKATASSGTNNFDLVRPKRDIVVARLRVATIVTVLLCCTPLKCEKYNASLLAQESLMKALITAFALLTFVAGTMLPTESYAQTMGTGQTMAPDTSTAPTTSTKKKKSTKSHHAKKKSKKSSATQSSSAKHKHRNVS